jgi:hypothetical protein
MSIRKFSDLWIKHMTPETRFHSYVLGITVSLMFIVIQLLIPVLQQARHVVALQRFESLFGAVAVFLGSLGAYRLVAVAIKWFLGRSAWLRSKLLGPFYLEGTWVGYFVGKDQNVYLLVEQHEQDLATLKVKGRYFTTDGVERGYWESDASIVDADAGTLSYSYYFHPMYESGVKQGLAVFSFVRNRKSAPPHLMHGYSANLTDSERSPATEKKLPKKLFGHAESVRAARQMASDDEKL